MGVSTANANVAGFCSGAGTASTTTTTGTAANCLITNNAISKPATIFFTVTATKGGNQDFNTTWRASCTLAGDTEVNSGGGTAMTPTTLTLVLPFPDPDSCQVTVSATQTKVTTTAASVSISLQFAPQQVATPTPSPTPTSGGSGTHTIYRGLGGKCVDDSGNSSANGAKVVIWTCNGNDNAQAWKYTNSQLEHNGKCLNDQRTGGNGSKVILYTCNGGANEKWTHKTNGEFVMKAKGGQYCLDDPASSKKDGTQLIVWKCNNATNQHWFASTVS
ncbi:MAG: RICIN domain-containing protein [Streptosporangiaceae bacterium]